MKTSNKILVVASLIVIAYLTVYDLGLQAEYRKGDYKKQFYHMQQLSFAHFNVIKHNAGNIIGLQIEKGPYGVWVDDNLKDKVTITQHDQMLQIDYTGKENYNNGYSPAIIITCPGVAGVFTNAFIKPGGNPDNRYLRKNGNSMIIDYYPHGITTVMRFDQPAMTVQANEFTEIHLTKNTLDVLNAKVGDRPNGKAGLTIDADNQLKYADFEVPGKSTLTLDNLLIGKVTYKLADSAQVNLTGMAVHLLDHPSTP